MSKQSKALRLADRLVNENRWFELTDKECDGAAAELRRQHALIAELVSALQAAVDEVDGTFPFAFLDDACAAIAKAEAQQ